MDWENLIEEIEDMGRGERRSLERNLFKSFENSPLVLHLHPVIHLTDDEFFEPCQINRVPIQAKLLLSLSLVLRAKRFNPD